MATLTVTARGQVTFHKDVLRHLGIQPGDKVELDKLPGGQVTLKAAGPTDRRTGKISDIFGLLADKTDKVASLEEIKDAIEAGWAGEV